MPLYAYTLDNAREVKDHFKAFDRDYYPLDVYQAILDIAECSGQSRALDVIAWCCDIITTDLTGVNRPLVERGLSDDDLYTFDDLVAELDSKTTILFADETSGTVYHLA